jgi:hypothetical protein
VEASWIFCFQFILPCMHLLFRKASPITHACTNLLINFSVMSFTLHASNCFLSPPSYVHACKYRYLKGLINLLQFRKLLSVLILHICNITFKNSLGNFFVKGLQPSRISIFSTLATLLSKLQALNHTSQYLAHRSKIH